MNVQFGKPTSVGLYVIYVKSPTPTRDVSAGDQQVFYTREFGFWDGECWCDRFGHRLSIGIKIHGYVGQLPCLTVKGEAATTVFEGPLRAQ